MHGDLHAIALGIGNLVDVHLEVDGAHDSVAHLLVNQLLQRRAVDLNDLVEPVDEGISGEVAPSEPLDGGTVSSVTSSSVNPSSRPAASASSQLIACWPSSAEVVHTSLRPHASASAFQVSFFVSLATTIFSTSAARCMRASYGASISTAFLRGRKSVARAPAHRQRRHAPKGGFVSNAGASAAFGGRICPRAPGRHEKRETCVHVRGTRVADHRRTGRRAERANRSSGCDDVAALLGLRTDVAVRDGAAAGRAGAIRSDTAAAVAAGRPARHDARYTARVPTVPPTRRHRGARCPR